MQNKSHLKITIIADVKEHLPRNGNEISNQTSSAQTNVILSRTKQNIAYSKNYKRKLL